MGRKLTNADRRREATREEIWPGSSNVVWNPGDDDVKGVATVSRLMPWIAALIRHLADKGKDPTGVYWELWCRDFGQSIVEIKDEEEHAFAAGYTSNRALRTWREHVHLLSDLGFVLIEAVGNREIGYVLLVDPLALARSFHEQKRTPPGWWNSFSKRAKDIGAIIPASHPTNAVQSPSPQPMI